MRDGQHAIAHRELTDALSNCVHDARHLRAWRERKRRLDLILALHLQDAEEIQAGRAIANTQLIWCGLRCRDVVERHRLWLAPTVNSPSFHGLQVLAFGPNSAGNIPYAPSTHSHSNGLVSRGSMISSTPNASAVRSGERKRFSDSSISRRRASGLGDASISRRDAACTPPSTDSDPQSPDG